MKTLITKSRFVHFVRCQRMAWLEANEPDAYKDEGSAQSEVGTEVGELARTYFGKRFTLIAKESPKAMAAATTAALKAAMNKVVCEASFISGDLFCSADIVRVNKDMSLDIYEVKSSSNVKDSQLVDAAFQMYVIKESGWSINRFHIMHINTDYVYDGKLNVKELFGIKDVTSTIAMMQSRISDQIDEFRDLLKETECPYCDIGEYCDKPYTCACRDFCFKQKNIPEDSVFTVAGLRTAKKYELYRLGIITPEQVAKTSYINEEQRVQVHGMKEGAGIIVNKDAIKRFLDTIRFPLYMLDFETVQFAIPQFIGTKPYEQVPFQYSLHIMHDFNGEMEHREFLAQAGSDDRAKLAEQLCNDIPRAKMSMAYNSKFERMVMRKLAEDFPQYAIALRDIVANIADLMIPFQKRHYYNPSQHGSYSIKAVLPAIIGNDDPELDYHALPVVHNGVEAMSTYALLGKVEDPDEVQRIRDGLLKYCCLDTLAMVKVLNALYELVYG